MTANPSATPTVAPSFSELRASVQRIGREIAAQHADDVDQNARFPHETFDALKAERVLSAGVPAEFGGSGCTVPQRMELCSILAQSCASAGMVLAMHFIKMGSITHFGRDSAHFRDYLHRQAAEQRLVASVTSEVGIGGNLRESICGIERDGDRFRLVKESSCLSYGAQADDWLITCKRSPDAAPADQKLVLGERGECTVEAKGVWNPMGLRGTCSPPFTVRVEAPADRIFEADFGEIAARTMVPETHIMWSGVWLGIATDAVARARATLQSKARKEPGKTPLAAPKLVKLNKRLQLMRHNALEVSRDYQTAHEANDTDFISSVGFILRVNNLKLISSEMVAEISTGALGICGFQGYMNGSPNSVTRHIRDALSAALMIGNDRIEQTNASLLMIYKGE